MKRQFTKKGVAASLIALGHIAHKTDSTAALNYLVEFASDKSEGRRSLISYALHALGFVASDFSKAYLEEFASSNKDEDLALVVQQSLSILESINKKGLTGYYLSK